MAKKDKKQEIKLERTYVVPLRKEFLKTPKYRRAKKAVAAVREFLVKHMKAKEVKLGRHLNHALWVRGIQKPPHHVKLTAKKDNEDIVHAELFGAPVEEAKKADADEAKAALEGKVVEAKAKVKEEVSEKKVPEAKEENIVKEEDDVKAMLTGEDNKEEKPSPEKKETPKKPAKEVPKKEARKAPDSKQ
jgi:large subunit ribosomal protein L31e